MTTYEELYKRLEVAKEYFLDLANKNSGARQNRFKRLGTIADILGNDVQNQTGTTENETASISMSLEGLIKQVKDKIGDKLTRASAMILIHAIRARTGVFYQFSDYTSKGYKPPR